MKVIFASSKGSQYRYFKSISRQISGAKVVTLNPCWWVGLTDTGLAKLDVFSGIDFHVRRKKAKTPIISKYFWLVKAYEFKSALRFVWIYLKFVRLLKTEKPDVVGVWNGHRLPEMAITQAVRYCGVKVVYFENGLLPNTTTMDFRGVNDRNSMPRQSSFYSHYYANNRCESLKFNSLEVRAPHKNKRNNQGLSVNALPERYIFVPFQVGFDSQVLINSNWIQSMEEYYEVLLKLVPTVQAKRLKFVVKEHPSDPTVLAHLHNRHADIVFTSCNTETLIRQAEAIMTINSTVGIESLMLEKKVIVLGEACFKLPSLVQIANNLEQLRQCIERIHNWKPKEQVLKGFLAYVEDQYSIPGSWKDQIEHCSDEHLAAITKRLYQGSDEGHQYSRSLESKMVATG